MSDIFPERSFRPVVSSLDAALRGWCRVAPGDGVLAGEAAGREVGRVLEVLDGSPVSEVAVRYGVSRQTVHVWKSKHEAEGLGGLREKSRRPATSVTPRYRPAPAKSRGAEWAGRKYDECGVPDGPGRWVVGARSGHRAYAATWRTRGGP
ncbi:helix-turn-helix domain-containing protein [Streptomyces sp. NPDC127033]|uniref:helix-turn-helix domain-containing protein n=1 Tax=Streptomyces sp. NPDC127033 TaxID=3347110 RepID=UPI00364D9757